MTYNLTPLHIRENFFFQEFGGKTVLTQAKSTIRPPHPLTPSPPQKSNGRPQRNILLVID